VTTRLVLVDDQSLVRTGFRMILDETADIEVVGEASDGRAALQVVSETRPDIVLMDVRMPGIDGIEATRRIRAMSPAPKVIILTTFDLDDYVYAGLRAGASGFLLKHALAADLISAVRAVASGESVVAPSVTTRLIAHFVNRAPAPPPQSSNRRLTALTTREREVLTLITHGRSNTEIAQDLHLSEGTVKSHIGRIFTKLDLRDRVQAVLFGHECGLAAAGPQDDPAPMG
jgi:DNA-binding NarL/FixJ family response regulator